LNFESSRMLRLIVLLCTLAIILSAQSPQATISGVIADPQGAMMPNVDIIATDTATGVKTATRTNEAGFYSLRQLPIGSYTVSPSLTGFRPHVHEGITLTTGQALELNITLELGSVSDAITVSANASLLETRNADAGQLIEAQTIEDMPLGDRRAMNLIEIT